MHNILIGNIISVGAAVFTIISSLSHGQKKIYGYQGVQCLFMAVANVFFGSFAGVTTFILCAIRNFILAEDKYTKKVFAVFLILIPVLGIASNNRGAIGFLPVITTVIYSIGQYILRGDVKIKGNITLNLILWAIYDFLILDIVSGVVDTISAATTVFAMARDAKHQE